MKLETILRNGTAFAAFMCGCAIARRDQWLRMARDSKDPERRGSYVCYARNQHRTAFYYLQRMKATQP